LSGPVLIAGAGLAGLSAAYHLEQAGKGDYLLLEAESRPGGLVRSERIAGFTFDYTGHLLHIKSDYMLKLMQKLCGDEMFLQDRSSKIIIGDAVTDYPIQVNTFGLPPDVIKECLLGIIKAKYESGIDRIESFEDWILKSCGEGVAKWFMYPYNEKMWTVHPREMTCDWMGGFVPEPSVEAAIDGAIRPPSAKIGYNAQFWYSKSGGIEVLARGFLPHIAPPKLNTRIEKIDIVGKRVYAGGDWIDYGTLISTLPVTVLVEMMGEGAPPEVRLAASKLKVAGIYSINYGVRGEPDGLREGTHWYYTPGEDLVFHRVGLPSNLADSMTPAKGHFSLCAEISYSEYKPISQATVAEQTLDGLRRIGLLTADDEILVERVLDLPYAYVIFDRNRASALDSVFRFLNESGIMSIGRYGTWSYSTMEQAILDGRDAACRIAGSKES